jgi:hypothetical protein
MSGTDVVTLNSVHERFGSRVAVLLEPGGRGAATLAEAAALGAATGCEVTVVALAPVVGTVCRSCGGVSARAYNCAVRDEVADELQKAVAGLTSGAPAIKSRLLIEGTDPSLERWIEQGGFDLVLLPSRRRLLRSRRHPVARRLRHHTDATIRVVGPPRRHAGD